MDPVIDELADQCSAPDVYAAILDRLEDGIPLAEMRLPAGAWVAGLPGRSDPYKLETGERVLGVLVG